MRYVAERHSFWAYELGFQLQEESFRVRHSLLFPWRVVRKRQEYQEEEEARSVGGTEGRTAAAAAASPWGIGLVQLFVEEQESVCCTFLHTGIEG
jgi:hypothetical protein